MRQLALDIEVEGNLRLPPILDIIVVFIPRMYRIRGRRRWYAVGNVPTFTGIGLELSFSIEHGSPAVIVG
jgi:hypothetical protein